MLAILLSLAFVVPASATTENTRGDSVTVAVAGEERVGLRKQGHVVLAFSSDGFEGECHVGRRSNARLITFRYHRSGTEELVRFRMPMRRMMASGSPGGPSRETLWRRPPRGAPISDSWTGACAGCAQPTRNCAQ